MKRVAPPVASFTSEKGRTFTIERGEYEAGRWGPERMWIVLYEGKPAGRLYRDSMYRAPLEWHATLNQLRWSTPESLPIGVGFDVSAFDNVDACLRAFARSADQILDWASGVPVHDHYGRLQTRKTAT